MIHHGDCIEVMAAMPDASVDTVGPDQDDVYDWVCFACGADMESGHIDHEDDCAWVRARTWIRLGESPREVTDP